MMILDKLKDALHYVNFLFRRVIFGSEIDTHIVICGYPRSGTSLLYNMIGSSLDGYKCEPFEVRFVNRLHKIGNYITKRPMDIFDIADIEKYNKFGKRFKVVICIRDIRDILTSKHPSIPDEYFIGFENSWWPQNKEFSQWVYNAPGIRDIFHEIEKYKKNNIDFILVKYEDLILDLSKVQNDLETYLDVRFQADFSDFHKNKEKHPYNYEGKVQAKDMGMVRENAAVDTSRLNKWKQDVFRERINQQFESYPELFNYLTIYGYEKDNHWYDDFLEEKK